MSTDRRDHEHAVNLAARAGGWSAMHWKRAFFGWLAIAVAAIALGTIVGTKALTDAETASGETATAERILAAAGFKTPATESVLVQSRTQTTTDPFFASTIGQVVQTLSRLPNVTNVQNPLEKPESQTSRDRHAALVQFDLKGDREDAADKVQPILDAVASVQASNPQSGSRSSASRARGTCSRRRSQRTSSVRR